ncbi:MAG: universal stress protein [Pseudomonadota bacterium]
MDRFKKILFFADGARGEKHALTQAMELAAHNNATITVVDVVAQVGTNDHSLDESIKALQAALVKERREVINSLITETTPKESAVRARSLVIDGEKDFIEVIRLVVRDGYDLLIKSVNKGSLISGAIFGNVDLRLMRQCPAPVWLIKPAKRKITNILAAVDLTSDDKATIGVSTQVLDIASGVARREKAQLHVVTAWEPPVNPEIRKKLEADAWTSMVARYKEQIHHRFARLVDKLGDHDIIEHIIRGKPDAAITKLATEYDVDLLVMGTLSRSGIPGLLIGNTAERVLSEVKCSVLTCKPRGFKTVIK